MQIWSNTTTLDGHLDGLSMVSVKETAEVALIGGKAIKLEEFPRLRGIFKTGVGRDNVPEEAARARGIRCGFPSPETCVTIFEETASFACQLILKCCYADVGDFAAWRKRDRPALASQTLLVIGAGNIGGRVAARMRAFLKVATFDTLVNQPAELEALVRAADCISLHVPLLPTTRNLVDARFLSWMKDGAALVNTGRGPLVDENALDAELARGRLRAAFDVFWEEPYRGKLLAHGPERFLVTPHVASTCLDFIDGTARDFRAFLRDLKPA